jgi:hypothetical protein
LKIKLDENIGTRGIELLRERDHDVRTVRDQGMSGAKDTSLFAACAAESRTLITLDRDFATTSARTPSSAWSISPSCAGASSATIRSSSRRSGYRISKADPGAASTITPRSRSPLTGSSSPSGRGFAWRVAKT